MMLTAQRALERIRKGQLAPGYVLLGREIYWRDRIWSALRGAMGPDSAGAGNSDSGTAGIEEFDLRQGSVDAVLSKAGERSLWAPRQLLLVRSAHHISGAKHLESVAAYFEDPSPHAVLVFEMMDVDLATDDWREKEKIKSRQERWAELCDVVLLVAPPHAELMEMIRSEAGERGRKISPLGAERMAAALDSDAGRIAQEIEKLCLYSPEAAEISESDVALLAGTREQSGAASLVEAVGSGDSARILAAFDELVPRGAYLPLVLADLARTLRQLLLLQETRQRDPRSASRALWNARLPAPQGLLPELLRLARAFSKQHLVRSLQRAFDADLALRSAAPDDRLILEQFLLDLARPLSRSHSKVRGGTSATT
jgi:DNA polymerase-3 subunit delta